MNTYVIGGQTLAIIDGELWTKVSRTAEPDIITTGKPVRRKRHYHKAKLTAPHRRGRKNVDENTKQEILRLYRSGKKQSELCEIFGLSYATVYRIARGKSVEHRQVPLKEIHAYRCGNCGRTFKSILPKLDAYCPQPTCNRASELQEVALEEAV